MRPSPHDLLYPWLEAREELLWAGRPDPFRMAWARTGLAVAGLAIIVLLFLTPLWHFFVPIPEITEEASSYALGDIHIVEAVPFSMFLAGIVLVMQPFAAYFYAGHTAYAVTSRRLLMVRKDMMGILIKTARYEAIEAPILNRRSGGTGDIFFFHKTRPPGSSPLTGFLGIRDAEQVHQIILSRIQVPDDGQASTDQVHDYLELLVQGKRGLDNLHDRQLDRE